MKTNVGVWIDHRKAVIISLSDKGEHILEVPSDIEKHPRYSGGNAEDQRDHRFDGHLHKYYEKVISHIRNADSILLLGPGEAKGEIKTRLEKDALGVHIAGVEAMDKVTDGQLAAKVREHFHNSP